MFGIVGTVGSTRVTLTVWPPDVLNVTEATATTFPELS